MKNEKVEFWDDERSIGNGIIVTLRYGWSFEPRYHEGVKGFDSIKESWSAVKNSFKCECRLCRNKNYDL